MKSKRIITIASLGIVAFSSQHLAAQEQPNVVFILADDLGWNDLSCMGSQYYETPNIDRLAKNGIRFTNAYAASQVSSPSRASILTGKYTTHHGITDWIGETSGEEWRKMGRYSKLLPADYVWELPKEDLTLAEKLQQHGYTTFFAGKWHLGEEGSYPENHGFDINIGGWSAGGPKGGYFSPYENPKLADGKDGENLSMRLANETVSFITNYKKKNKKKPFLAYLSFYAVHGPIQTTEENWSYFRDKAEKMGIKDNGFEIDRTLPVRQIQDNPVYAGLIKQMDDAVGRLLDALEAMNLDKNTLIIFTSDNGGVTSGDNYSTSLLPLRGGKGRQWEGGIRVPLLIQTPKMRNLATTSDIPVIGMDYYPTILDFAGIRQIPEQHKDGVSLLPVLDGMTIEERQLFWHYPHYGNQGGEPSSIIRKGDWKLIYYHENHRCELYNLAFDLSECEPLNIQYPNKIKELKTLLDAWLLETNAIMPKADLTYSPQKESEFKRRGRTVLLKQQEDLRNKQLSKGWKPNKDWWGSKIEE